MENPTQPKSEAAPATHNNQPKGDAPDLSKVSLIEIEDELQRRGLGFMFVNGKGIVREAGMTTDALTAEIYRRHQAGECVALVITPDDLSEEWECDDAGNTHPGSRVPESGEELKALRRAFDRWLDCGAYSDVMETLRDAWLAELDRKEKGDAR